MASKWIAFVVFIVFSSCESASVDSLPKCALKDFDCQKELVQKIITEFSQSGLPENEVPPFDPIKIKDYTVSLLGLLNITVKDADGVGVKDCIVNSVTSNIEKGMLELEVTCDIMIKGKFKISGTNPIAGNSFGGGEFNGDGNGEINLEKLHLGLKLFYGLVKKDDGEIYFSFKLNKSEFIYDLKNFQAKFDKILLGDKDVSEGFVAYLNENWKFLLNLFQKTLFDTIIDIVEKPLNKLLEHIPASKIITNDLTPFLKNK